MNGNIRKANAQDYQQVERLMQQIHILHANWRPDIYKHCSVVLSEERFLEHIKNEEIVVLEKENSVIGVMIYLTRNISGGLMQDRKILFIDALALCFEICAMQEAQNKYRKCVLEKIFLLLKSVPQKRALL